MSAANNVYDPFPRFRRTSERTKAPSLRPPIPSLAEFPDWGCSAGNCGRQQEHKCQRRASESRRSGPGSYPRELDDGGAGSSIAPSRSTAGQGQGCPGGAARNRHGIRGLPSSASVPSPKSRIFRLPAEAGSEGRCRQVSIRPSFPLTSILLRTSSETQCCKDLHPVAEIITLDSSCFHVRVRAVLVCSRGLVSGPPPVFSPQET